MLVAETYVGHRDDASVASALADSDPHRVVLSDTERRRSRVRTETTHGRDLGVVVGRVLADGDVLETDGGEFAVVELASVTALVVDFAAADAAATTAVELGHAAGNRHWDLAVRGTEALFPATESRDRMAATLADVLPEGATTRFEDVPPETFDGEESSHSHGADVDHSHGRDAEGHSHRRDGGAHSHDHDGDDHSKNHTPEHSHTHARVAERDDGE